MLTRDQKYTLRLVGNRLGLFIPKDMINYIGNMNDDPKNKVNTLLKVLARSMPAGVKIMLSKDPSLLMQAGNVVTAAGHTVLGVTPYEFVLGECDHYKDGSGIDMINLVASYFSKIPDGEKERLKQYARYQPAIEKILTEKPTPMLDWIFDVLENNTDTEAWLAALEKFRNDEELKPRVIRRPEMHCKYANPRHALWLYREKFDALYKSGGNSLRKCNIALKHIVQYVMCGVSASDRMRLSNGLHTANSPIIRSLEFKNGKLFSEAMSAYYPRMIDFYHGDAGKTTKAWRANIIARESEIAFLKFCVLKKLHALREQAPNPALEFVARMNR